LSSYYAATLVDSTPVFNNCTLDGQGLTPLGRLAGIFNNCFITTKDAYIESNGGEHIYNNCTLTRTGSVGTFALVCNVYTEFNNCTVKSSVGGIRCTGNDGFIFHNSSLVTENGQGIYRLGTTTIVNPITITNSRIESTGGDCVEGRDTGFNFDISDTRLISNSANQFCLRANKSTVIMRFDNLRMKNTADSNDVYGSVDVTNNNTQIETTDAYGNIILA
jgi:hypothetical protein